MAVCQFKDSKMKSHKFLLMYQDDAQLAQMLQDEENGLGLQQRTESTSQAVCN